MKLNSFIRIFLCFLFIVIIYMYWSRNRNNLKLTLTSIETNKQYSNNSRSNKSTITVAVVACGDRLKETLTMIKSAIMFTKSQLTFIIVCEDNLKQGFEEKLLEWKSIRKNIINYKILSLTFPKDDSNEWRRLFKPCAAQRLFLPSILTDVDSVLYVDTDTLFLTDLELIWSHFDRMNSSQMAALAPEHEDPNVGWYNRFARHPYYGPLGVNSGVMLMNLTRMRHFQWTDYMVPIYRKYKLKITWGDQDIINIIFHYHPDKLYVYSCRYNYRPDHCMYMSVCKSAEEEGVAVLHGSRGFFHSEKQPVFQLIYQTFEQYQFTDDLYEGFLLPLETYLETTSQTNCGHVRHIFLKNVQKFIEKSHYR